MATLANRNNNPGNLRDTKTGSFRTFGTPQEGYAALLNDLQAKQTGTSTTGIGPSSTLADFAKVYAPSGDSNNPAQYTANLANHMKVRPDTQVKDLDLGKWADSIANAEGYAQSSNDGLGTFGNTPAPTPAQQQSVTQDATQTPPPASKPDLLQKTGNIVNSIFPGKQVGQAIGTLGGLTLEKIKGVFGGQDNSENYDTSAPSPLQVGGDIAQGGLMVGTGLPEAGATTEAGVSALGKAKSILPAAKSVVGRIGQAGLIGAGTALTQDVKDGGKSVKDIAKDTALGTGVGLIGGGAGEAVSKVADVLPLRLARSVIKTPANEESVAYAMKRGLGSPTKMIADSNSSITSLEGKLGSILGDKKYANIPIDGKTMLNNIANTYADSGLDIEGIASNLKKVAPLKTKLVDKLVDGTITFPQLQSLKSEIGKNTFKTVFDEPAMKAGKQIGNTAYHVFSDFIKTTAPESAQVIGDLSKEYPLNQALQRLSTRAGKASIITLKDIVTAISAYTALNPLAATGVLAGEKILTSPTATLHAAGLVNQLSKPGAKAVARAAQVPVYKGVMAGAKKILGQ